jgi:hypothetical protein
MADFKVVGKLVIDDKGQLKVLGKKAKQASKEVDRVGTSAQTADRRLKGAAQASSGGTKKLFKNGTRHQWRPCTCVRHISCITICY